MMLFLLAQFLSQEMGERRQEVESLLDSIDSLLPVSARQVSGDIKDQAEDISAQWQAMDAILKDKMAGLQQSNQRQEDFEEEYRNLMADVDNFHWMDNTTVNDNSADIATNLQAQLDSLEVSDDERCSINLALGFYLSFLFGTWISAGNEENHFTCFRCFVPMMQSTSERVAAAHSRVGR